MANPSLQIGNNNWAIKEDNLLGYSTAGTRFVPQPITMTRATLGTRVNPSGLVEDVELLGSELVVNGDFATDSDWVKQTGWTISGGTANANVSGSEYIYQNISMIIGTTYKVTYDIVSYTSGQIRVEVSSTETGLYRSSVGTFTEYITPLSATLNRPLFRNTAGGGFVGSIDNVSVKEATIDNLPRVDYTDGTSSLLVEPQSTNLVTSSEDFTDSSWTKLGAGTGSTSVVTSNYAISPDGTQNATRLVCDLNGGTTTSDQSIIYDLDSSNTSQSISIYIKSNTGLNQNIYFANTYGTGDTAIVTSEWQRFEFNHSTSNHTFSLGLRGDTGADDTADILIWGAQAESNSYATSYIKTSGSTVTRNQETYTKTGISDKINSEEGVLFAEISRTEDESNYRLLGLDNGTSQNYIKMGFGDISGNFWIRAVVNSVTVINSDNAVSNNANQFYKIAVRYKSGDSVIYIDGVPVLTSSTTFSSGTFTDLDFTHYTGALNFYGKVKQLQIFKTALSDSELATLTT